MLKRFLSFLVAVVCFLLMQGVATAQAFKSEAELRKQAEKDFKEEDYAAALPLYSQLLSLNQKDPKLNYRYGICLLMADKDKTSAYNYLEFASRDAKTEAEVYFYMGRALQLKYRFDEAISAYSEYIKRVGASAARRLDTEQQIATCKNAKELLKTRTNITVKSSREISKNALYGAYDFALPAGKLLATSDNFMTALDKKKVLTPVMFLTADGQTIYYAGYGKSGDNGKDIYIVHKLPSGAWGEPKAMGTNINTKQDEDYPYLDADGKTLYFSSRGHNSMGGFDLFKSVYNKAADEWSAPENLGAGINSPDDDFFYMPVSDSEAQYASSKESAKGLVMVYRIEVASSKRVLATVRGRYKSVDQARADGKISVLRKSDNGLVAKASTDQRTGQYELLLPTGDNYIIVVEAGGYMTHVENFSVPQTAKAVVILQQVSMNRNKDVEQLEIRNQYLQSGGAETANAEVFKKPEVIKKEYKMEDMQQQLQPLTIDGQVVYATPPSSMNKLPEIKEQSATTDAKAAVDVSLNTNVEAETPKAEDITKSPVTDAKQAANEEMKTVENNAKAATAVNKQKEVSRAKSDEQKQNQQEATENGSEENVGAAADLNVEAKENNAKQKEAVKGNEKSKTVITDGDIVKMALNDAKELEEEAAEMKQEAATANAKAVEKDNVSKQQLTAMTEALKKNDEPLARELSRQSQLNADSAQQSKAKALQLEEQANVKQAEANKAFADAKELEKTTAANTGATIAKGEKKKEAAKSEKKNAETTAPLAAEQRQEDKKAEVLTGQDNKTVEPVASPEQKVEHNAAGEAEAYSSNKVNDTKAEEVKKRDESQAETPGVAREEKKAVEAGGASGAVEVVENKKQNTVAQPITVNPASSKEASALAATLLTEMKDLKLQSEALREQAKKSNDKEESTAWLKQANALDVQAKEKGREADKQLAIAKKLKKEEEREEVKAKAEEVATVEKKNEPERTEPDNAVKLKKETRKEKAAVATIATVKAEDSKSKKQEAKAAADKKQEAAESKAASKAEEPVALVAVPVAPAAKKEQPATATTVVAKPAEPNPVMPAAQEQVEKKQEASSVPANLPSNVTPEAVASYKEYIKTKQESDAQERQSEEIQSKIASMPPSAERDRLVQQSNDLNMQSIKTWQQAQVKLGQAKEIDPAIETKLKDVQFTDLQPKPTTDSQTAESKPKNDRPLTSQELERERQKDSLLSQAVSHRVMAENTTDSTVEKAELYKTRDLIVESGATTKKSSSATTAKTTTTTAAKGEQAKKSAGEKPSAVVQPSGGNERTALADVRLATKEAKQNDSTTSETFAAKRASSKTAAVEPTAKATTSSTAAPARGDASTTAVPVLDARTLKVDEAAVFSISSRPVYSESNPVPMDPQLPEGLVFKVQIGAFRAPLPASAFKNVEPLSGESTRPGWIRYCVGLFRTFEPATMVKTEMRSRGYKDAFVVAYYNGKRISLGEAYAIINRSGANEKGLYADASAKEIHHLNKLNITLPAADATDPDAASFFGTSDAASAVADTAVEYAVQVGVYKTNIVPKKLQPLIPLNAQAYKNDLYRFTTGRFALRSSADSMRLVAVNAGVPDAFIIIYRGNKRTTESVNNIQSTVAAATTPAGSAPAVANDKVTFKVQLAAYRLEPSVDKLAALMAQCNEELSQSVNAAGLHIVYAGSFNDYNNAVTLKANIITKGIKDAFVVAFIGEMKVPLSQVRK